MKTREEWLVEVGKGLEELFFPNMPPYRVSVGFPTMANAIAQCWSYKNSRDGHYEIFISPKEDNDLEAAGHLAHEMIHAFVGIKEGHKGKFKEKALSIGLQGKMTSTTSGEAFIAAVRPILERAGKLPHAALLPYPCFNEAETETPEAEYRPTTTGRKPQKCRMIKVSCPECGYTVRVSKKWIEEAGYPLCPQHEEMTEETKI